MQKFAIATLLAMSLLLAIPTANAQANGQGISASPATLEEPIAYMGSATANVTVNVGCIDAGQSSTVTITAVDAPAWLTVGPASVSAAPSAACLNAAGSRTATVPVPLTVGKDAPGVVPQTVNLTAKINGKSATTTLTFSVDYYAEFEMSTDVQFPLNVTGKSVSFNLTVAQKSNARSMVMMENVSVTSGSLSGLASVVYEADSLVKVFNITYKAPTGAWSNATASFTGYTHYLLTQGGAGDFAAPQTLEWTFVNADGGQSNGEAPEGKKKSPAPVAPVLALSLLAAVALMRRR